MKVGELGLDGVDERDDLWRYEVFSIGAVSQADAAVGRATLRDRDKPRGVRRVRRVRSERRSARERAPVTRSGPASPRSGSHSSTATTRGSSTRPLLRAAGRSHTEGRAETAAS